MNIQQCINRMALPFSHHQEKIEELETYRWVNRNTLTKEERKSISKKICYHKRYINGKFFEYKESHRDVLRKHMNEYQRRQYDKVKKNLNNLIEIK